MELENILYIIKNAKKLDRDDLHTIAKCADDIIVERFIKGEK
mgnify:CR=1 FL=1|tara:strand:+ start:8209 stop:8334 length:126 start_codon:yes stop_codon:yes gene_type:complete